MTDWREWWRSTFSAVTLAYHTKEKVCYCGKPRSSTPHSALCCLCELEADVHLSWVFHQDAIGHGTLTQQVKMYNAIVDAKEKLAAYKKANTCS